MAQTCTRPLMAVALPGELVWVLNLLGFNWPEADEDRLRECAQHWRVFAAEVGHVRDDANRVAATVCAENRGASIDAFHSYWQHVGGSGGHLDEAQEAANLAAAALDGMAVLIEGIKAAIVAQLIILAAEIIADQLAAPETLGASEALAAGEVVVTRSLLRRLIDDGIQQLLKEVVRELRGRARQIFASMLRRALITGAMSTGLDFARQEVDIYVFHSRSGLSWQELAFAGGTGAVIGGLMPGHHREGPAVTDDMPTEKAPPDDLPAGDPTASGGGTVPAYRAQGRPLISVDENGNVSIDRPPGRKRQGVAVHVGFDGNRAQYWLTNLGRGEVVQFDVDQSFLDRLRATAQPEHGVVRDRSLPWRVDVDWPDQYAIPPAMLDDLERAIVPGSGKVWRLDGS